MQGHLWVPRMGPRLLRGPFRLPSSHYAGDILISPYPLTSKWLSEYHSSCPSFSSVCMFSHVQLSCDPMDCSLPVHGILQARILEWVAVPFSRGSFQPKDRTQISHVAGGFFTSCATREVPKVEILFAYKDRRAKIVILEMFKLKIYFCLVPVEILT